MAAHRRGVVGVHGVRVVSVTFGQLRRILEAMETPPATIEHSGQVWTSTRRTTCARVWPIAEYLARRKHSPNVRDRIERMNPYGHEEGSYIRGWEPSRRINYFLMDVMPVKRFIEKYGREAYRSLPHEAFIRRGHRKAIMHRYIAENF